MVSVLSNINITMYHVFIVDCDKNFMSPLLNFNVETLDGEDDTTLVPIGWNKFTTFFPIWIKVDNKIEVSPKFAMKIVNCKFSF